MKLARGSARLPSIFCVGVWDRSTYQTHWARRQRRTNLRAGGATFGLIRCAPILSPSLSIPTVVPGGTFGAGFEPSWYVTGYGAEDYPQRLVRVRILVSCMPLRGSHRFLTQSAYKSEFDTPYMINAYTAPNTPATLRDEFTRLDR